MFCVFLMIRSAFTDFFAEIPSCVSRYQYGATLYNHYVSNCVFGKNGGITGNGGVFCFENAIVHFVVEECSFDTCYVAGSSYRGGAIYFSCSSGGVALSKVCAYNCYMTSSSGVSNSGVFAYLLASSVDKIQLSLVTMNTCSSKTYMNNRFSSIYIQNSNTYITNFNSSYNYLADKSGFELSSCIINVINFTTVASNISPNTYVVSLTGGNSNQIHSYLNIVNNSSPYIIYSGVTNVLRLCVFTQNSGTLFQGAFSMKQCSIVHPVSSLGSYSSMDSSNCINNDLCLNSTHDIPHFASHYCITPTPAETPSPTIIEQGDLATPHQSIPLSPTNCIYESIPNNSLFLLSAFQISLSLTSLVIL